LWRWPIPISESGCQEKAVAVGQWVRFWWLFDFFGATLPRFSYRAMVAAVDAFLEVGSDAVEPFASLLRRTRPSCVIVDVAT
jgi:hypothetical protein